MTKLLMIFTAALAAALLAAGCGDGGTGGATEDALSFMPKDAPVIATVETDPEGDQLKQANELLGKFPFAGQVRQQIKEGVNSGSGVDYEKDIKPVLGNQLVFVVPSVEAVQQDDSPVLLALKAKDEGKAEDLVKKDGQKVGSAEGTDIYKSGDDTFVGVTDGVLIAGDTQADVEAAIKRHGDDSGMTGDDLDSRFAGIEGDGLLNVGVDAERLIAESPEAADARKVKWIAGLRDVGFQLKVVDDGVEADFKATTENVTDADLPLASGSEAAPVVRRPTDIGFGLRNVAQSFRFGEAAGQAAAPSGEFADYEKKKAGLNKALGIDIDQDVVAQLDDNASISVGLDGGFAMRSDLKDPEAFKATLAKAAPKLKEAFKDDNVAIVTPKRPDGFYALAAADGKKFAFAVIEDKFVLATDAARATQFAGQSATPVDGAKGSVVMAMDTRTIANQAAKQQGQSGAELFTGVLGDATGWVETSTDGMTGHFKQVVK